MIIKKYLEELSHPEYGNINVNPTEKQKESGNYSKGHTKWNGFDISIENPKGSYRRGTDPDGKEWKQKLHHDYGYIKGTEGKDKDHLDVFLGQYKDSPAVYVVNQKKKDSDDFDEHKIMIGFKTLDDAKKGYLMNYEKDWDGVGSIKKMKVSEFKNWVNNGNTKEPIK